MEVCHTDLAEPPLTEHLDTDRQTWDGIDGVWLLAILVVGVFLRCYPIHEHVWIDELHTAWSVSAEGTEFYNRVRMGNNGPLYFLLVKQFTELIGLSEWTLRLVSLIAGVSLLPLTFWMVRTWKCSIGASLLATALLAIDSNAVFYSIEARPYACVQLLSLLHLWFFSRLLMQKHSVWDWIAWNLSGVLMFQMHCTSALIFAAQFIAYFALSIRRVEIKLHWIYFGLGQLVLLAGMLPSVGLLREVASRRENWSAFVSHTRNPIAMLTIFPMGFFLLTPVVLWLIVLGTNALRLRFSDPDDPDNIEVDETHELVHNNQTRQRLVLVFVAFSWLFVPILAAWLLTERDVVRLFYRRYLMASSVGLAPLTALLLTHFLRGIHVTWMHRAVLLLALLTISSARYVTYGSAALAHSSEDWHSPINQINADSADVPIVLYSGLVESTAWHDDTDSGRRSYLELPVRGLYTVAADQRVISLPVVGPQGTSLIDEGKAHEILRAAEEHGIWLLIRGDMELASKVQNEVLKVLGAETQIGESLDFGAGEIKRVHLRRIR